MLRVNLIIHACICWLYWFSTFPTHSGPWKFPGAPGSFRELPRTTDLQAFIKTHTSCLMVFMFMNILRNRWTTRRLLQLVRWQPQSMGSHGIPIPWIPMASMAANWSVCAYGFHRSPGFRKYSWLLFDFRNMNHSQHRIVVKVVTWSVQTWKPGFVDLLRGFVRVLCCHTALRNWKPHTNQQKRHINLETFFKGSNLQVKSWMRGLNPARPKLWYTSAIIFHGMTTTTCVYNVYVYAHPYKPCTCCSDIISQIFKAGIQ